MPFIVKHPSPTIAKTGRLGAASAAPMGATVPCPIEPKPRLRTNRWRRSDAQVVQVDEHVPADVREDDRVVREDLFEVDSASAAE